MNPIKYKIFQNSEDFEQFQIENPNIYIQQINPFLDGVTSSAVFVTYVEYEQANQDDKFDGYKLIDLEEQNKYNVYFIKNCRTRIDKIVNIIRYKIKPTTNDLGLAFTQAHRAKMWLGRVLKEIGASNPYPQSDNPASPQIEPPAEHSEDYLTEIDAFKNPTAKVKYLRQTIQVELEALAGITGLDYHADCFYTQAVLALEECKMWLGMELNNIRESENQKK